MLFRRRFAILLTLALIALLIANSAGFYFHEPYYESWDMAANSLAIGRAKHFAELHGAYSRWGFHHPGPAYFYALALGEWLFYDVLRLTPAPYNAQALAQLCLSTAFYMAALTVFARRLPVRAGVWFWPLAITAGALHFGFASRLPSYDFLRGPSAFTSTWGPHESVLPFLCLLTAGASVAAGGGGDLPLLAVAAGSLLHLHVAQPLFVLPLTLLAYVGLVVECTRRERAQAAATGAGTMRPWRAFRRAHLAAAAILAVFALPLALDLFQGADSNLAAILHHLRTHHGEYKTFVKSLLYLAQFGAYAAYQPGRMDFGHFDGAGVRRYLHDHAPLLVLWVWVLQAVIGIAARPVIAAVKGRARVPAAVAATTEDAGERGRFLAWAGWFLLAGIGLTLYWGVIQDGEMFFYNAWLNFGLYYFGSLVVITDLAARLEARPRWRGERLVPAVLAVAACALLADRWRVRDAVPETTALMHESIRRALDATCATADPARPVVFDFADVEWPVAAAVGLEMTRGGRSFYVSKRWADEFGHDHADGLTRDRRRVWTPWRFQPGPDTVPWRSDAPEALAPVTRQLRGQLEKNVAAAPDGPGFLLLDDTHLSTGVPTIRLRDREGERELVIDFRRGGNASRFFFDGWSDAEPWGTWSVGQRSALRFAVGIDVEENTDVEMTVELHPFVFPPAGLTAQRLRVRFDGDPLAPAEVRVTEGAPPLAWTIPGGRWRAGRQPNGVLLEFDLPDAASPAALDRTGHADDTRLLGVGISEIRLRLAPPASSTR